MFRSTHEEAGLTRLLPSLSVSVRAVTRLSYLTCTASPSFETVFLDVAPGSFRNSA
jgi:hypothetical protein